MYDNLIETTVTAVQIALLFALVHLVVGLVRPNWTGAAKRSSVIWRSLGLVLLAFLGFAGVIGYTHSQPDGPHSFDSYMKSMSEEDWKALRSEPSEAPAPSQN